MIALTAPPDDTLVSCLCVTRGKPNALRRAIRCFAAQTHPAKELVIVYESDDPGTRDVVREHAGDARIRACEVDVSPKRTLGELRNLSVELSRGEYFCQWDDDDWYHVDRVRDQLRHVRTTHQDAAVLTNWLVFDAANKRAYFSHFRYWEGSIFCRKAALRDEVRYPAMRRMEDTFFINSLIARGRVVPMVAPSLYLYVVHRTNTWNRRHFQIMLAQSQPLSPSASRLFEDVLDQRLDPPEASQRLSSPELLRELKYLYVNHFTPTNQQLESYRIAMDRMSGQHASRTVA